MQFKVMQTFSPFFAGFKTSEITTFTLKNSHIFRVDLFTLNIDEDLYSFFILFRNVACMGPCMGHEYLKRTFF